MKASASWKDPISFCAGLAAAVEFEALYVDQSYAGTDDARDLIEGASKFGVRVFQLAPGVLERVADASTPQPVIASVRLPVVDVEAIEATGFVLVLHDVRDPGNAGTLVRSADATGASGVVFTGHSVDPFNAKTLRATAGSIFHVPVAVGALDATLSSFERRGATTLATVVRGGVDHRRIDFSAPTVVVVGNESEGLDDEAIALCRGAVTIEMVGRSESLNAGVAGSLIAFESMWQRRDTTTASPPPSL